MSPPTTTAGAATTEGAASTPNFSTAAPELRSAAIQLAFDSFFDDFMGRGGGGGDGRDQVGQSVMAGQGPLAGEAGRTVFDIQDLDDDGEDDGVESSLGEHEAEQSHIVETHHHPQHRPLDYSLPSSSGGAHAPDLKPQLPPGDRLHPWAAPGSLLASSSSSAHRERAGSTSRGAPSSSSRGSRGRGRSRSVVRASSILPPPPPYERRQGARAKLESYQGQGEAVFPRVSRSGVKLEENLATAATATTDGSRSDLVLLPTPTSTLELDRPPLHPQTHFLFRHRRRRLATAASSGAACKEIPSRDDLVEELERLSPRWGLHIPPLPQATGSSTSEAEASGKARQDGMEEEAGPTLVNQRWERRYEAWREEMERRRLRHGASERRRPGTPATGMGGGEVGRESQSLPSRPGNKGGEGEQEDSESVSASDVDGDDDEDEDEDQEEEMGGAAYRAASSNRATPSASPSPSNLGPSRSPPASTSAGAGKKRRRRRKPRSSLWTKASNRARAAETYRRLSQRRRQGVEVWDALERWSEGETRGKVGFGIDVDGLWRRALGRLVHGERSETSLQGQRERRREKPTTMTTTRTALKRNVRDGKVGILLAFHPHLLRERSRGRRDQGERDEKREVGASMEQA